MGTSVVSSILVIDAFEFRRAGISALLAPWAKSLDAGIVSLAPDQLELKLAQCLVPIFVVLSVGGLSLQMEQVLAWAADIRHLLPHVPCLILSDRTEPEEAVMAARMGEQAFMSTRVDPQFAIQACALVTSGGTYFPKEALQQIWGQQHGQPTERPPGADELTRRQHEVLEHLRLGRPNKLIARSLSMQESTVKVHVREIMRKLGARNRTEAAMLGANDGPPRLPAAATHIVKKVNIVRSDISHVVYVD